MTNKNVIYPLLKGLVTDLSEENYNRISELGSNGRLTIDEISSAIHEYPGHITVPPEYSFDSLNQYDYNENPDECAIEFDLWFDNQKSDLTLQAEIIKDKEGKYNIQIHDILVM